MRHARFLAVAALTLTMAHPGFAQQSGTPTADEVQTLRQELERLRREAEERQRQQEERIRQLEQQLQELQKRVGPAPTAPPPNPVTVRPGFRARLYGYARVDADLDTRKIATHPHLPFWVFSPDDPRARNARDGSFTLHPRLTRLGLDTEAPPVRLLGDARLTGKIETDFFNFVPGNPASTSNSRQFLRIRHAYGRLDWKNTHLIFGQTWDLISPLFPIVNYDVLMWNAGNLGDRRPQIRIAYEPPFGRGRASLAAAVLSSDAVGGSNRDGDFQLDGEESRRPLVQVRAALQQPSWVKGQTWELGLWAHNGAYRFDRAAAIRGRRSFEGDALGLDLRVPLTEKLLFQGEAWTGRALADVRGGIGQDINPITGALIHSRGGWAELIYQFNPVYALGAGFSIDDPDNSDVPAFGPGPNQTTNPQLVGRTLNRTYYLANRFNLGSGLVAGVDWMLFHTRYRGISPGTSNRWNIWLQHNF